MRREKSVCAVMTNRGFLCGLISRRNIYWCPVQRRFIKFEVILPDSFQFDAFLKA